MEGTPEQKVIQLENLKSAFHAYLSKEDMGENAIFTHMDIFNHMMDLTQGDTSITTIQLKMLDLVRNQKNATHKRNVFDTYRHFVRFQHISQGKEGNPFVEGEIVEGELVFAGYGKFFEGGSGGPGQRAGAGQERKSSNDPKNFQTVKSPSSSRVRWAGMFPDKEPDMY